MASDLAQRALMLPKASIYEDDASISNPSVHQTVSSSKDDKHGYQSSYSLISSDALSDRDAGVDWRPFWLRRSTLAAFIGVFLLLAGLIIYLDHQSRVDQGLVEFAQQWQYVWRFAPTAILTLVAALWSRTEVQARRYMPWIILAKGQQEQSAILALEYVYELSPVAFYRSLRNRHFLISLVLGTTVILEVVIILSTSLFYHGTVDTVLDVPVRALDSFAPPTNLTALDASPYYVAKSINALGSQLPFGLTEVGAYQKFEAVSNITNDPGKLVAPLSAIVDGIYVDVQCVQLESISSNITYDPERYIYEATITPKFQGCGASFNLSSGFSWYLGDVGPPNVTSWWTLDDLYLNKSCSNLPRPQQQFAVVAAFFGPSAENISLPVLGTAGGVVCSPHVWTSKVEVVDNGVNRTVQSVQDSEENPIDIDVDFQRLLSYAIPDDVGGQWANCWLQSPDISFYGSDEGGCGIVQADSIAFRDGNWVDFSSGYDSGVNLDNVDHTQNLSLYTSAVIEEHVQDMYSRFGPFVSHYRMRQSNSVEVNGTRQIPVERLLVDERIAFIIAGLCFLIASLTLVTTLFFTVEPDTFPRDPATLLGILAFLKEIRGILPAYDSQTWASSRGSVLPLRTWVRTAVTLALVCLIVAVGTLFHVSQTQNGIATLGGNAYLSTFGLMIPGLLTSLVSLYITSCNGIIRNLSVFSLPSSLPVPSQFLDMSLVDMLGFRAFWQSLRMGLPTVTISQTLTFFSAFLTSLSSILFTTQAVPKPYHMELQQGTWFGNVTDPTALGMNPFNNYRGLIGSLLLKQADINSSYPTNTYDTLVFPVLEGLAAPDGLSNVSATAEIPAVQLVADCVHMDRSEYTIAKQKVCIYGCEDDNYYYQHMMSENITCPDGSSVTMKTALGNATSGDSSDNMAYLGALVESAADPITLWCPGTQSTIHAPRLHGWTQQTYAWGSFDASSADVSFFTAMRCNYSWVDVDVELTLVGGNFTIDSDNPPRIIQNSSRPHVPVFPIPDLNGWTTPTSVFPAIDINSGLGKPFRVLLEPYGPVALESLGSEAHVDEILAQLTHDFTMAAGQLASSESRLLINQTSISEPFNAPELDTVPVTIYDVSRRRLVQNAIPTYLILCILVLIVLVNIWALVSRGLRKLGWRQRWWMLDMNLQGLAPEEPGSIAAQAALLYESNIIELVPPGAWYMKAQELEALLIGSEFRLGWFHDQQKDKAVFTIGLLGDENMPFLGAKEEVSRMQGREIGDVRMPLSGIVR
ncbi:hypothetical protein PFICI_03623 [Pestalotiopsis fici W106-1]|uniref:Uncharacterized protein n=1 Tax=Pestalotiopsis fici (strain W106-1 / CGMCC3.15140) TaxID=1229662 RepID=W3XHN8_PESFW|nr:uncharacterized protein PFICI_03623 [Pestalotiopsis fici W106-1]ETS85598.1 hypothetical protein PFICI_03623 [Pestalotiopsis fici W106-1]